MRWTSTLLPLLLVVGCASQNNQQVRLQGTSADWPFETPQWAASAESLAQTTPSSHRSGWVIIRSQVVTSSNPTSQKLSQLISMANSDTIVVEDAAVAKLVGSTESPLVSGANAEQWRTRVFQGQPTTVDFNGSNGTQMRMYARVNNISDDTANVQFEAQCVRSGKTVSVTGSQQVDTGYTIVRPVNELSQNGETAFLMIRADRIFPGS